MEEIYENLDDIQHSSEFSSDYTTHKGGKLPSQSHKNSNTYEVVIQDGDLPNILKEISMFALENNKQTNHPTPPSLHEKLDAENFEVNEERTTYDEEARVDTPMELDNEVMTIKDEEPKEMNIIEIPLEKPSDPPKLNLEPLPNELKYAFLRDDNRWLVMVPSYLSE